MNIETRNIVFAAINNIINFCGDKSDVELWANGPTGEQYMDGLVRDKGNGNHRGSYVPGLDNIHKTIEFLQKQDWYESNPIARREGCKYYQCDIPENGRGYGPAYVGVTTVGNCRDRKWSVVKRPGEHGPELIHHNGHQLLATNTITLIIEDEMMSTWHPGEPMYELPNEIPDSSFDWKDRWPVKLV